MISRRGFLLSTPFLLEGGRLYATGLTIPNEAPGVELASLKGWHANTYPWDYQPQWATVHPVPSLWDPPKFDPIENKLMGQLQSPAQIREQSRQLYRYGSGADVLEFNVAPGNPDYNHWLRTYLGANSDRPFYILYEHVNGNTNYVEYSGEHNMDLFQNKKAFVDDIDFIINYIVIPNQHRYVTVGGKAVIYLWAPSAMIGDFATLLQAVKLKYPVFFVGSVGLADGIPRDSRVLKTLNALDGYMDYGTAIFDKDSKGVVKPDNYKTMTERYAVNSKEWRKRIGNKLFIPTFQAAYDDSNYPGRTTPLFYPRTREEMEYNAAVIKRNMTVPDEDLKRPIYDNIGPLVVYSEIYEGAAVLEQQCLPQTIDRPGRFVGCGTGRLKILKSHFGN